MSLRQLVTVTAAGLVLSAVAWCDSFSSVVVYGDSLSDNGNLYAATAQLVPGPPYFQGRRSNGPVAVEQVAADLHVPLVDHAWIGATTGIGNIGDLGTPTALGLLGFPGMTTQLDQTESTVSSQLGSLFIVWGGPNDFLSPSSSDTTPQAITTRAVGDLVNIVQRLQADGVKNILVPGMPDLGLTPAFQSTSAQSTAITNAFNGLLLSELPAGVTYVDTASLLRTIVSDPSAYGFSNVTDPCFTGTSLCSDPSQYLFFDSLHPTTQADALLAQEFIDATATPEPASVMLLAAGLGLVLVVRRLAARSGSFF